MSGARGDFSGTSTGTETGGAVDLAYDHREDGALGAKIVDLASHIWPSLLCHRDDERDQLAL